MMQDFAGATYGVPTIFTMKSSDPRWAHARKGVARAFSGTYIRRALLRGQEQLNSALDRLAESGESFDPATLMTELTLAMLGQSMLGGFDFGLHASATPSAGGARKNCVQPSLGQEYMDNLHKLLPEYASRQPNDPLRKHMIRLLPRALGARWFPLAAEAERAARRNMQISQQVLDAFRLQREEATPDERVTLDETIMGHLVANQAYESDEMRAADVAIFIIAGYDTTGFTLAWLLCELARYPERAYVKMAQVFGHAARSSP